MFSHHAAFGPSHALSMLGNFIPNLQNLQQSDVLEKLKMQVGLIDPEFSLHSLRGLHTPQNTSFTIPQNGNSNTNQGQNLSTTSQNNFSFTPPNAPHNKDGKKLHLNIKSKYYPSFDSICVFVCKNFSR